MQVIGPTFRAYAGPFRTTGPFEYGVSVAPLANIYAGLNYALHRYGSLAALGQPGGYDAGGWLMPGLTLARNSTGVPERVVSPAQEDAQLAALDGIMDRLEALIASVQHNAADTADGIASVRACAARTGIHRAHYAPR